MQIVKIQIDLTLLNQTSQNRLNQLILNIIKAEF